MIKMNLELIIDDKEWKVEILNNDIKHPYYAVNLYNHTLYINYEDVDKAKYAVWQMYHGRNI